MTFSEYLSVIYENICCYYNMNHFLTVLVLNVWVVMTIVPFVMNCKGMRTTFLTPFMWTVLNFLFGPIAWVYFLILGGLPIRNYVRPIDTKWNFILPVLISVVISRFKILDESNILGIVVGTVVSAAITIALMILELCRPNKTVYVHKEDVGEFEYKLKDNYMYKRRERNKMRNNSEYTYQTYDIKEHSFISITIPIVSQKLIDTCYMRKIKKRGMFKEVVYQKPNREEITILQLDYPIESYLYSYLVGVLVMLWINLPYLMMIVNYINYSLEG